MAGFDARNDRRGEGPDDAATSSRSTRARPRPAPSSSMRALQPVAHRAEGVPPDFPRPAGSSTIRRRSGRRVVATVRAALAKAGHRRAATSPRSASPISARPRSSGTARPASRSTTRSSGRTGAPPMPAQRCRRPATKPMVTARPGCCSIRISRPPRSPGCSTTCRARATAAERGELAFGTVDTFLIWRLTGGKVHATDATNAARTLLFDIDTRRLGRRAAASCSACRARCCRRCATAPTISARPSPICSAAPIPILGVAGDQQAATIGQACFTPGMMKSTYGTGCFALLNTGDEPVASRNRLLTTIAYQLDGKRTYALEGAIFIAGAAVQWLRDGLQLIEHGSRRDALAQQADPAEQVYLVPAFVGPRRALVGCRGARRDLRAHPQHRRRRARARRARSRRLPDPRSARRHARGLEGAAQATPCCASMAAWSRPTGPCSSSPTFSTRRSTGRPSWRRPRSARLSGGLKAGVCPDLAGFAARWQCERRFRATHGCTRRARANGRAGRTRLRAARAATCGSCALRPVDREWPRTASVPPWRAPTPSPRSPTSSPHARARPISRPGRSRRTAAGAVRERQQAFRRRDRGRSPVARHYQGEFFALLGPSGCGKTTLLRHARRLRDARATAASCSTARYRRRAAAPAAGQHDVPELCAVSASRRSRATSPSASSRTACRRPTSRARVDGDAGAGQARGLRRAASRTSFPAASASASRLPARSPSGRRCCCWMSRCRRSTSKLREETQLRADGISAASSAHLHRRHPRPGRGDDGGRPHRRDEQRPPGAGRRRRPKSTSGRIRAGWPISSATSI